MIKEILECVAMLGGIALLLTATAALLVVAVLWAGRDG